MDEKQIEERAEIAQIIATAEAVSRAESPDVMQSPPDGFPALTSILTLDGNPTETAVILGYVVQETETRDTYGPDGGLRHPGDPGFLEAHQARLFGGRPPTGWQIVTRRARMLYAIVEGNPISLEALARAIGYPRALAVSPNALQLGEVD